MVFMSDEIAVKALPIPWARLPIFIFKKLKLFVPFGYPKEKKHRIRTNAVTTGKFIYIERFINIPLFPQLYCKNIAKTDCFLKLDPCLIIITKN